MSNCPIERSRGLVVAVESEPEQQVEATKVGGKLCFACKGQREKQTGPIDVEIAATIQECDVCAETLREIKRRQERAFAAAKPRAED